MRRSGNRRRAWVVLALAVVAVAAVGIADAAEGKGRGQGKRSHQGGSGRERGGPDGGLRGRLLFGEISSQSDGEWAITPQIPPELKERAAERGLDLPDLPASISFKVGPETQFYAGGESASAGDFSSGDEVVVKLNQPWQESGARAEAIADPQTARDYILEKLREGRGPGGPGGKGKRPGFGVITAISAGSLTIRPTVPDFIKAKLAERGNDLPDLPESVSGSLSADTRYVKAGAEVERQAFKVGDEVAVLARGEPGDLSVIVLSDLDTAKQRMQDALKRGGGEGKGKGKGKHTRNKDG